MKINIFDILLVKNVRQLNIFWGKSPSVADKQALLSKHFFQYFLALFGVISVKKMLSLIILLRYPKVVLVKLGGV